MATAPVTGFTAGVAIGAVIAAAVTRRLGRRAGFMVGTLFPIAGGALATAALFAGSFWLLVAALLLAGFGNSFVQRYSLCRRRCRSACLQAAGDLSGPDRQYLRLRSSVRRR